MLCRRSKRPLLMRRAHRTNQRIVSIGKRKGAGQALREARCILRRSGEGEATRGRAAEAVQPRFTASHMLSH